MVSLKKDVEKEKTVAKWPDHGGMVVPKEEVMVLPKMTGEGASGGESRAALLLGDEGWYLVSIKSFIKDQK